MLHGRQPLSVARRQVAQHEADVVGAQGRRGLGAAISRSRISVTGSARSVRALCSRGFAASGERDAHDGDHSIAPAIRAASRCALSRAWRSWVRMGCSRS